MLDYVKLSQELGLHKTSLDMIKGKKSYIDQITRFKDTVSVLSGLQQQESRLKHEEKPHDPDRFFNNPLLSGLH
jgi:hypothetical protein